MGIADRIIVVYNGEITAEFTKEKANQLNIIKASIGEYKEYKYESK
jgi:ABC-type sugar transport system ATPase subunit